MLSKKTSTLSVTGLVLGTALGLSQISVVHARPGGISGYSGMQGRSCTSCHDGGATPTVRLSGPTSVLPGSTNMYTLTISGGERRDGSLDVAASAGALAATQAGTKLLNGEVVHSAPKAVDSAGNAVFNFNWTAPASGSATLYGAGLSSSGNGESGSMSATSTLAISVAAAPQPTPTPTPSPSPVPSPSPSPSPLPTPKPTPSPTPSPQPTPTPSPVPSPSPSPIPSPAPSPLPGEFAAKLEAPYAVRVDRGEREYVSIVFYAKAASLSERCGTVFLQKNGVQIGSKQICPARMAYQAVFAARMKAAVSSADAGTVRWSAFMKTWDGRQSVVASKSTIVRAASGNDGDDDDDDDDRD